MNNLALRASFGSPLFAHLVAAQKNYDSLQFNPLAAGQPYCSWHNNSGSWDKNALGPPSRCDELVTSCSGNYITIVLFE
jgi:hypothetical protein